MPPTVRTTPSGMLVVVAVAVWPGWIGRLGFQDSVTDCPESWVESDVIAWSPVLETCIARLGAWFSCSKLMLALTWCFAARSVEPPVWIAMSVWEQSTLLLRAWVQTPLPLVRVVGGSSAVFMYWSLVLMMGANPVFGLAAIPKSS